MNAKGDVDEDQVASKRTNNQREISQGTSDEWLNGRPNPGKKRGGKKIATKEQNSLVASLRTRSSFIWSEYSHCAMATAAQAQTGTRRPYDTEIKYSTQKSSMAG